jgi:hypothetical protein
MAVEKLSPIARSPFRSDNNCVRSDNDLLRMRWRGRSAAQNRFRLYTQRGEPCNETFKGTLKLLINGIRPEDAG